MSLTHYHITPDSEQGIFIAYGANLPWGGQSAMEALVNVVKQLQSENISVKAVSSLWQSEAWPDPSDPPYMNAVLKVVTSDSPEQLLEYLHKIEAEAGRVRYTSDHKNVNAPRNAPRTLDLDLIAYHDQVISGDGLIVPHPRAHERGFVMGPLAEIAPDWVHPLLKRTASDLYAEVTVGRDAHIAETTDEVRVSGS
ncbi:MAG: 2-amino-4-hydroxy-6-hydroxymethyldihydropteridine diphosphokinase [Asticcacaulis sp.]